VPYHVCATLAAHRPFLPAHSCSHLPSSLARARARRRYTRMHCIVCEHPHVHVCLPALHAHKDRHANTYKHAHTSCVGILWPAAAEEVHRPPNKPSPIGTRAIHFIRLAPAVSRSLAPYLAASRREVVTQEKAHALRAATAAHNGLRATIIRYTPLIILNPRQRQALRDALTQVAPRHFDFLRWQSRHG
jgi:hypothetical protein